MAAASRTPGPTGQAVRRSFRGHLLDDAEPIELRSADKHEPAVFDGIRELTPQLDKHLVTGLTVVWKQKPAHHLGRLRALVSVAVHEEYPTAGASEPRAGTASTPSRSRAWCSGNGPDIPGTRMAPAPASRRI